MWKRWWLLHGTDFQSLMYPCFIIGRILGMFPYKINALTFEASKSYYILSTVAICICSIYNITIIYDLIFKINLGDITRNLEAICHYMCCGFIMIITHILSGSRMRLLQTILKISSKLPSKSCQKLSRFIHVKDILGTIIVIVQLCIYFPKTEAFNFLSGTGRVFSAYCFLVLVHTNMLYINCVYVLKACFKNMNDNLTHIQKLVIKDTRPSCVSMLIGHIMGIFLIELKTLKKRHLMLSNAVQMMNIVFSLQILATIVMTFSITTFELYFYIVHWRNGILIISFDNPLFDKFVITIIFYVTQMMLLVWICETGKNQAQQIRTTIHDLLNNTSDKQIKDELQLFSLQLLHCDNTFSAKGLNVDATLFAALMGSIMTYILILIQFLITSHSCDQKSILHK